MPTTYHSGPCPITAATPATVQPGAGSMEGFDMAPTDDSGVSLATVSLAIRWQRGPVVAGQSEQLKVYGSVYGTWPYDSTTATLDQIVADFNDKSAANPILQADQIQLPIYDPNVVASEYSFRYDNAVAYSEGLTGFEVLILNEETHQFVISARIPLTQRNVSLVGLPAPVILVQNPLFPFLNNTRVANSLPTVAATPLSDHLHCSVTPYTGATTSSVRLAFYDSNNSSDSSLMSVPFQTFGPITWSGQPFLADVAYASGSPAGGVTVIAFVDGVPSAPVSVTVPGSQDGE